MNQTLPTYQVRISKRAKYARLVMKPRGLLEVVLPMAMNHQEAEEVVRSHLDWIVKQQQQMLASQASRQSIGLRPSSIDFPSLHQTITVKYMHGDKNSYQENDGGLTVFSTGDESVPKILQHWLKYYAGGYLPSKLFDVAQEMDENYKSVSVRLQKTRWGSCSNQRRINLNAKLLLLPEALMRYVLVHELSHLQHLNHGKEFWQRVAQFEPDYAEKRQTLRVWSENAPDWLCLVH